MGEKEPHTLLLVMWRSNEPGFAPAWLLFRGKYAYGCALLIPLSRVLSPHGSGTSHTSSSPGSSPMPSLRKNRLRDSESCTIMHHYYELLLLFQRWPSSFYRTLEFFIWSRTHNFLFRLNVRTLSCEKNLWRIKLQRFGGFRSSEMSILSASHLPYMLLNSLICKAGLLKKNLGIIQTSGDTRNGEADLDTISPKSSVSEWLKCKNCCPTIKTLNQKGVDYIPFLFKWRH